MAFFVCHDMTHVMYNFAYSTTHVGSKILTFQKQITWKSSYGKITLSDK